MKNIYLSLMFASFLFSEIQNSCAMEIIEVEAQGRRTPPRECKEKLQSTTQKRKHKKLDIPQKKIKTNLQEHKTSFKSPVDVNIEKTEKENPPFNFSRLQSSFALEKNEKKVEEAKTPRKRKEKNNIQMLSEKTEVEKTQETEVEKKSRIYWEEVSLSCPTWRITIGNGTLYAKNGKTSKIEGVLF